ncbi:MAG: ribbon-helix-helix domain-containing protein [Alphaproteobacteria bacterium]|nr:ribbon-helix-helix domain-containing protein [Alphaproteobacteria bacterium]
MVSTLINRNVTVAGHRTSMRLEPSMWEALEEICRRERRTVHDVCTEVDARRHESTLTAALRAFIVIYFRVAATEDGHINAGHGSLEVVQPFRNYQVRAVDSHPRFTNRYRNRANAP